MDLQSELTTLASCFNLEIYKNLGAIIHKYPWKTGVAKKLVESSEDWHKYSNVTIQSILNEVMIKDELSNFLEMVDNFRNINNSKEFITISKNIFDGYKKTLLAELVEKYQDNPLLLVKKIKQDIPDELSSLIKPEPLGARDAQEVLESEMGDPKRIFQSNYDVVRDATPYRGYTPGQVVMFCGKPGGGKSAAMLEEEIINIVYNPDISILHIALGDMTRIDFINRFTSVLTQTRFAEVVINPSKYFTPDVREVANRIDLVCLPSRSITGSEIVDFVENSDKYYDMVVVDYDSNVKSETGGDNMYEAGGELYDQLTAIARPEHGLARLVLVASQPKTGYWDKEIIPLEGAGESSRKQHVVDMMVTLGVTHSTSGEVMGIMHIAKARRGSVGGQMYYKMSNCGKLERIEASQYAMLKVNYGR